MHRRQHTRPIWQHHTAASLRSIITTEPLSAEQRMADVFVQRHEAGRDDTTQFDLLAEGFSEGEIIRHYPAAKLLADKALADRDVADDNATYDRDGRVLLGATLVAGMLLTDTGAVNAVLRQGGLSQPEVGSLWPDIIGGALRIVRMANPEAVVQ